MRCIVCYKLSIFTICKNCLNIIKITPRSRELDGFKVYSFYDFSEVSFLLSLKYDYIGSKVYSILSKKVLSYVQNILNNNIRFYGVAVDDRINNKGYSHSAILLSHLKKCNITPMYHTLISTNNVNYAGKSLEFREKNPRNFVLKRSIYNKDIVLFDDIITTGLTIKEARDSINNAGGNAHFAFVLSDAKY